MIEKQKAGYIKAFDGIRALAIIMILIFHYRPAGFEILSGGFIGVDVFFVLSGYLITMLLTGEWKKTGKISLKKFWLMRSRRLLPAVFALIIILTLLAAILPDLQKQLESTDLAVTAKYLPDMSGELTAIQSQALPAIGYYINWYFIYSGKSYFELMDRPSLFGHLWSLAIEEQFYLFWPVLMLVFFRIFGRRKYPLAGIIFGLGLLSACSLYTNGQAAPFDARGYFGTDSRAYALMLGALLSIFFQPNSAQGKTSLMKSFCVDFLGFSGLALLGYLCWTLTGGELFIFRGGLFLASLATAVVIIAGLNANSIIIKSFLSNKAFGWIGKRSYGLYLWHWPVFILTESYYNYPIEGLMLISLRVVLLLGLVELSYRFIENPIRYGAIGKYWRSLKNSGGKERMKLIGKFSLASALSVVILSFCLASLAQAKTEATVNAESEPVQTEPATDFSVTAKSPLAATVKPTEIGPAKERGKDLEATAVITPPPAASAVIEMASADIPVIAIGDSVMLGSRNYLMKEFKNIKVDAVVGRQFTEVEKDIATLKKSGRIPPLVFIHTGNNGTIEEKLFIQMMDLLSDCRRVVIFTVRVPRPWQNSNNEIFFRVVPRYPNAILVDWQKESSSKAEYFAKDGIHLRSPQGTGFYTALAKQALFKDLEKL